MKHMLPLLPFFVLTTCAALAAANASYVAHCQGQHLQHIYRH